MMMGAWIRDTARIGKERKGERQMKATKEINEERKKERKKEGMIEAICLLS